MLKLYGATKTPSLDNYRHVMYMQRVSRKSLTSDGFLLESPPPTSPAAKHHTEYIMMYKSGLEMMM